MIRITRNLMVGGFLSLAVLAGASVFAALPARADYQSGVDAYYKGDFRAAYDAWLPLAEAGDAVAQNSLGALYDHGLGVTEDNLEAARWYEMAAQQGMPLAMRNLGTQYATGHGLPYDLEAAKQWYERAAAAGDQQSVALLNHLRPSTAPVDASAAAVTPTFTTPSVTGNLAEPGEAAVAPEATSSIADSSGSDDLVIADAPTVAPAAPVSDAPIALDLGSETVTMPATGAATTPQPAPAQPVAAQPAAVQQAAVTPVAPSTRTDGNWLIGQWQGPSLGCPQAGGVEFTDTETLSWFDGQVAVRLSSTYQIAGDNIVVTATGGDGVPQQYTYQRGGADKMIIVSIPTSMPKSLLGIAYRRCGPAPAVTQAASAAAPAAAPVAADPSPVPAATPIISAAPAASTPAASTAAPTTTSEYSLAEEPVVGNATAAAGWKAFEQGQYEQALATFKSLGEAGDTNMQVIVGNIYDYGQGVPQDDVQAMQWYLMAAERGNPKGQYQAGALYYRSQGVPQDLIESYRWLTLAAEGPSAGMASDPSQSSNLQAKTLLNTVASEMSAADIATAKALAKKSKKKN